MKSKTVNENDFEILYWIEYMNYNDPRSLSKEMEISEEDAAKKLLELEKRGWISLELRDNKIYGSQLTSEGKEVWNDNKYKELKLKLGY